jgi:hypothetical protein
MSDVDFEIELPRVSTGNEGLDEILDGGLDQNRMYQAFAVLDGDRFQLRMPDRCLG